MVSSTCCSCQLGFPCLLSRSSMPGIGRAHCLIHFAAAGKGCACNALQVIQRPPGSDETHLEPLRNCGFALRPVTLGPAAVWLTESVGNLSTPCLTAHQQASPSQAQFMAYHLLLLCALGHRRRPGSAERHPDHHQQRRLAADHQWHRLPDQPAHSAWGQRASRRPHQRHLNRRCWCAGVRWVQCARPHPAKPGRRHSPCTGPDRPDADPAQLWVSQLDCCQHG